MFLVYSFFYFLGFAVWHVKTLKTTFRAYILVTSCLELRYRCAEFNGVAKKTTVGRPDIFVIVLAKSHWLNPFIINSMTS